MDEDFAVSRPLVRPGLPRIRFLFVGSRLRSALPSDLASRRRPCASLALHLHQVVQGTCTPRLSNMLGTRRNRSAVGKTAISAWGRSQPLAPPVLTSLVACTSALRRAILRQCDAGWRLRSVPSLRGGLAHRRARAPFPSIQSTYSKGRASRGFVLRGCIRKAGGAWVEAALVDGLADTRFFR
jgi:hypothetical protein